MTTRRPRWRPKLQPNQWPKGPASFPHQVLGLANELRGGRVLCVDPATGSTSLPGYAIYEAGVLIASGVIQLDRKQPTHRRLRVLRDVLAAIRADGSLDPVDVLVIEQLRGRNVHSHLHWSTGVIVESVGAEYVIEVPIPWWKAVALADPAYTKSDDADARKLGQVVLGIAAGLDPVGAVGVGAGVPARRRAARAPRRPRAD